MAFLKKLKQFCYDAVIPLLCLYPRDFKGGSTRDICTTMYIVIFKQPVKGGGCPNVHGQMNGKNVAYTYNKIFFSFEIETESLTQANPQDICKV